MEINKEKFLASLMAMGLMGAVACGGDEPEVQEAEPAMTTGAEDTYQAPPEPVVADEPMVAEPEPEPAPTLE